MSGVTDGPSSRLTDREAYDRLWDIVSTQRAMRRLHPDPVPEEDLRRLVSAAGRAGSGENLQPWSFIVVTDPELRSRLGKLYAPLWKTVGAYLRRKSGDPQYQRIIRSCDHLGAHMGEAPAIIVACTKWAYPRFLRPGRMGQWGSVFPAIQNLLLAARALGLGATLTTLHLSRSRALRRLLEIPRPWQPVAVIPVGFPQGRFAEGARKPVAEILHWNTFRTEGSAP
jgi:nitroreductase